MYRGMSERAIEAYSNGEKPLSKWTKEKIVSLIGETYGKEYDMKFEEFKKEGFSVYENDCEDAEIFINNLYNEIAIFEDCTKIETTEGNEYVTDVYQNVSRIKFAKGEFNITKDKVIVSITGGNNGRKGGLNLGDNCILSAPGWAGRKAAVVFPENSSFEYSVNGETESYSFEKVAILGKDFYFDVAKF